MSHKKEIYWYQSQYEVIMGYRGGSEYRMPLPEFTRAYLNVEKRCLSKGQPFTEEDAMRILIKESQYIDFEEVKPETKLLL